jgi:hypothetical protein
MHNSLQPKRRELIGVQQVGCQIMRTPNILSPPLQVQDVEMVRLESKCTIRPVEKLVSTVTVLNLKKTPLVKLS